MKTRRKTVVLVSILIMAGCSANRQTRHPEDAYISPEPVPGRMRHADEYDFGDEQYEYEYEAAPSRSKTNDPAHYSPSPSMREPAPAPPAIGISRVKSVSWLRCFDNKSSRSSCGDSFGQSGCATGSVSPLPPDYFLEGCTTPPRNAANPPKQCRDKTTLVEVVRGWERRPNTRIDRVFPPRTCGEQVARRPGCYAPPGCASNQTDDHQHATRNAKKPVADKSLVPKSTTDKNAEYDTTAYPLHAEIEDQPGTVFGPDFSSDDRMGLPANIQQKRKRQQPHVPAGSDSPGADETPASPLPGPVILPPLTSGPLIQQVNPDSVNNNTRPPMWPRLGQPSAESQNLSVAQPWCPNDSALPVIQPGRRI